MENKNELVVSNEDMNNMIQQIEQEFKEENIEKIKNKVKQKIKEIKMTEILLNRLKEELHNMTKKTYTEEELLFNN
jgi:hypothetical protein